MEVAIMKEDHAVTNNDRKSQGVASATPAVNASNKESGNRKGEGKEKAEAREAGPLGRTRQINQIAFWTQHLGESDARGTTKFSASLFSLS